MLRFPFCDDGLPSDFNYECPHRQITAHLGPYALLRSRDLQPVSAPAVSPGIQNPAPQAPSDQVRCHTSARVKFKLELEARAWALKQCHFRSSEAQRDRIEGREEWDAADLMAPIGQATVHFWQAEAL